MATLSGTLAFSKAYDDPTYRQPDPLDFPATSAGANGLAQKFISYTGRQIKSVTVLPTNSATAAGNVLQMVVVTGLPVLYVGAGGGTCSGPGGTNTNTLTILNLGTYGSGNVASSYFPISGGTYNIQLVNTVGTTTATNVVIPQGLAGGGIPVQALDQFWVKNGTDAQFTFLGEIECFFTPGTSMTL